MGYHVSETCVEQTFVLKMLFFRRKQNRKQILFANTLFMCVRFYPSGVQILTGGSNRRVAYWEVLDGSLIREVEASSSAAINALDISPDGSMFASGGNDEIIKVNFCL